MIYEVATSPKIELHLGNSHSLFHVNLRTSFKPCLGYSPHFALTNVALTFCLLQAPAVAAPYSNLSGSCSGCFHLLLHGALC